MKKVLQKIPHIIIPHKSNNNVPYILKETTLMAVFLLVLVTFALSYKSIILLQKLNLSASIYPAVLADLTNVDRTKAGVGTLKWSPSLAEAAKLKAEDMIKNEYFAHTSPAGVTPWFWLNQIKYDFFYAGENLAIQFNRTEEVQDAWFASSTHKANILNDKFTEIGIAAVDGMYQGKMTTFVVEYFGTPADISTLPVVVQAPPTVSPTPVTNNKKIAIDLKNKVPEVKGVENERLPALEELPNITTLEDKENMVVVQNNMPNLAPSLAPASEPYTLQSSWYERLALNPSNALRSMYMFLIGMIMTAMTLVIFKEYQKHHLRHLALGTGVVVAILFLIYFAPVSVFAF